MGRPKGSKNKSLSILKDPIKRFESKLDKISSPYNCWIYKESGTNGYGYFWIRQNRYLSHRYAWNIYNGEIPDDKLILHNCDIYYPNNSKAYRKCCNPNHLRIGDHKDNSQDTWKKGRGCWQTGARRRHENK